MYLSYIQLISRPDPTRNFSKQDQGMRLTLNWFQVCAVVMKPQQHRWKVLENGLTVRSTREKGMVLFAQFLH